MMNKNQYYLPVGKLDELLDVQRRQPVTLNLIIKQKSGADSLLKILDEILDLKTQYGLIHKLINPAQLAAKAMDKDVWECVPEEDKRNDNPGRVAELTKIQAAKANDQGRTSLERWYVWDRSYSYEYKVATQ